jgi:hypothetical protein
MKLDAARGEHTDAKCERSCRPFCGDDMCGKIECCPVAACGLRLGARRL